MITNSVLSEVSTQAKHAPPPKKGNELGQDVFLELMITQMRNQNPLDPQDNSAFVAQLAQFSSVEGLDKLNTTTEKLAAMFQSSQALQASSMVGRTVKVNSETAILELGKSIAGTIDLPFSSSEVEMNIYNASGVLVAKEHLGQRAAGEIEFAWNGKGLDGELLNSGEYRFEVLASSGGDTKEQLETALSANVDSVSVGQNGTLTLNVAGVGPVSIAKIKEIL